MIITYDHKPTRTITYQSRSLAYKNQIKIGDKVLLAFNKRVFAEAFIEDVNTHYNLVIAMAGLTLVEEPYEVPVCANKQGRPYAAICKVK
jgi:uncharacterized membrane protein